MQHSACVSDRKEVDGGEPQKMRQQTEKQQFDAINEGNSPLYLLLDFFLFMNSLSTTSSAHFTPCVHTQQEEYNTRFMDNGI